MCFYFTSTFPPSDANATTMQSASNTENTAFMLARN